MILPVAVKMRRAGAPVGVATICLDGWYGAYGSTTAPSTANFQGTNAPARIDVCDVRTAPIR